MAVLLVGRQCWVRRSAIERYDARFWRNSVMTSFAGSKSWNFWGRRGVNSSTALRTAAGSNEDISSNATDVDRETGPSRNGHDDATARTILCLLGFTANVGQQRGHGLGRFWVTAGLRTVRARCRFHLAASRGRVFVAAADCSLPCLMAWTGRGCGLFADTD
jgi:hypothetical protein